MSISLGPAPHLAHFISELKNRRPDSVLDELARVACASGVACEPGLLRDTLLLRERLGSTAVGHGVAVPNARSLLVTAPAVIVARSRRGIAWAATGGEPVHMVLLVLSPGTRPAHAHVAAVAQAVAATRAARRRQKLLGCADGREAAALLAEVEG